MCLINLKYNEEKTKDLNNFKDHLKTNTRSIFTLYLVLQGFKSL